MFTKFRRNDDEGVALIMVTLTMMIVTVVITGALWYAVQTQTGARRDQDWNGALAAAQAGVDDYLSRLNKVDTYWQTTDCTNVALKKPMGGTCTWGASTPVGWLPVTGSPTSSFHYDVDTSGTYSQGTIKLTSTGKVGKVKRSVVGTLRKTGFGEFLYYTDFETIDPATEAIFGVNNVKAQTLCSRHYWDNPTRGESTYPGSPYSSDQNCPDINFVGGDELDGPVHSNDAMLMQRLNSKDPWFKQTVTTSYPTCLNATNPTQCYRSNGTVTPKFDKGISYRSYLPFPATIVSLKPNTDPTVTPTPGCLYTGPTRIKFVSGGKMKVWSRYSKTLNTGCGNPSSSWPQTVNVPNNNLIYVQDIPAAQTSPVPPAGSCADKSIDASTSGDSDSNQIPVPNDYNNTLGEANCRYGTVYVEGTLSGRVTIAADNNIIVTGDTTYVGGAGGTDALGLIASNFVKVFHPVKCNTKDSNNLCTDGDDLNRGNGSKFTNPKIHAAMLSVKHSFTVQTYNLGDKLGNLTVFGTIAQLYRGPVGTSGSPGTGYFKDYHWDSRLKYAPPPFFLDPVGASWGQKTFGEVKAAQ
jgi:hypothetical protein